MPTKRASVPTKTTMDELAQALKRIESQLKAIRKQLPPTEPKAEKFLARANC